MKDCYVSTRHCRRGWLSCRAIALVAGLCLVLVPALTVYYDWNLSDLGWSRVDTPTVEGLSLKPSARNVNTWQNKAPTRNRGILSGEERKALKPVAANVDTKIGPILVHDAAANVNTKIDPIPVPDVRKQDTSPKEQSKVVKVPVIKSSNTNEASADGLDPEAKVKYRKWIIGHPNLDPGPIDAASFPGWHILVPPGFTTKFKSGVKGQDHVCSECMENADWNGNDFSRLHQDGAELDEIAQRMQSILYTIQHQARQIALVANLTHLKDALPKLLVDRKPDGVVGLEYIGPDMTFDSYHFHHRPKIEADPICKYRFRKQMHPLMTAGIRCRFTTEDGITEAILMDEQSPPVFTSEPKLIFTRLEEAVFQYDAFWAIFAALFSPEGKANIWGLWAQRLMQEIDAEVGLVVLPCPKDVSPLVSPESPSDKIKHVFSTVTSWSCPVQLDLLNCSLSLAEELAIQGHVTDNSVKALQLWLAGLRNLKYNQPPRQPFLGPQQRRDKKDAMEGCIIHNPALVVEGGLAKLPPYNYPQKLFPNIEKKCAKSTTQPGLTDPFQLYKLDQYRGSTTRDIALVIVFNYNKIYTNIIILEELHRKYFNQIIYCGSSVETFAEAYTSMGRPINYIEIPESQGIVGQECLARAMMMNHGVRGYLQASDDVILNSWTFASNPQDRFWFQSDLRVANRHQKVIPDIAVYDKKWPPWTHGKEIWGRKPFATSWSRLKELQSAATNNNPASRRIADSFFETLEENSGGPDLFFYSPSDIFYVPARYRREWIFLSDIFMRNKVHLELAVPTVMNGLDKTSNIVRLEGKYIWYDDRINYRSHYKATAAFLHPYKISDLIDHVEDASFMCFQVLPHIVDDLVEKGS